MVFRVVALHQEVENIRASTNPVLVLMARALRDPRKNPSELMGSLGLLRRAGSRVTLDGETILSKTLSLLRRPHFRKAQQQTRRCKIALTHRAV
jgi:hypothetical protein